MKKHTKSVFGILLALAMVLTTVLPALLVAAEPGIMPIYMGPDGEGGSITLKAPSKGDDSGEYVNLENMRVNAYLVLETDNAETNASNLFTVTKDFKDFFAEAREFFYNEASGYVKDGTIQEQDMYITFGEDKTLKLYTTAPEPLPAEMIKIESKKLSPMIAIDEENQKYFESALMAAILKYGVEEVDGASNAANAKLFAEWLRRYAVANGVTTTHTETAAAGADPKEQQKITLDGLDFGYWLLVSENAPADVANVEAIFRLVKEDPSESIQMKLEEQLLEKKVNGLDETTAGANDILGYTITTKIPDLTDYDGSHLTSSEDKENYKYTFSDTLHNQWLVDGDNKQVSDAGTGAEGFVQGVFTITIEHGGTSVTLQDITVEGFDLASWEEGTVLPLSYFLKDGSSYGAYAGSEQAFELNFDVDRLRALELKAFAPDGWKEAEVKIAYNAELTSDAVLQNENEVTLNYSNDPNTTEPKHLTDDTKVYTYGFNFEKHFEGTDSPSDELKNGVTFQLFPATTGADSKVVKDGSAIKVVGDAGAYEKADSSAEETVTDLKLSGSGSLSVYGLKAGYYILEETAAPAGYAKIKEIVVYIDGDGIVYGGGTSIYEGDVTITGSGESVSDGTIERNFLKFEVTNLKGMNLPDTGGAGVWMLLIGGVLLITLAGALVMNHRKHNTAE